MKVLVLGASGGVGKHLVRLACDQGHVVTALVRRSDGIDSRERILIDDAYGTMAAVSNPGYLTYLIGYPTVA